MTGDVRRGLPAVLVTFALASSGLEAQKPPPLPDLLKSASDYVAQYAQKLNAVAADEEFVQYETSSGHMGTPKRINSLVVLFGQSDGSIANFRDVVGIDNVPVRPKDDRLAALFKIATPVSIGSAQEMTDDAVRAYISPNLHLLDKPTFAMDLLRPANQDGYTFKVEGMKKMDGAQVAVLKFNEKGTGHLMTSAAAVGRFWVDPATGTIHQIEIGFVSRAVNVHATITFASDAQLGLWLPAELFEQVETSSAGTGMSDMGGGGNMGAREALEGRATYAKYRRASAEGAKHDD